jgi:5-methylcytosine-specific restriction endonuclease McrA
VSDADALDAHPELIAARRSISLASDRTLEWRAKSQAVLRRENYVCQGCGGRATQAHHLTYEHAFNEFLFELVAVCEECHAQLHADRD